ncbi:MAG: hypothetical protein IJA89_07955 [Clostridia bacterium]|nr:hypothetical protein [Clostridia bacterium]
MGSEPPSKYDSEHIDYVSEYTQEEHIVRIVEHTKIKFQKEDDPLYEYGYSSEVELSDCKVEIVYAIYDNDPEYFVSQMELKISSMESVEYPEYVWCLGLIHNDKYMIWEKGRGINPYIESGNGGAQKYYGGGHFAVDTGDGVLKEIRHNKDTNAWDLVALTEIEKFTYGKYNDTLGLSPYSYIANRKHVDYVSKLTGRIHIFNISNKTEKLFKGRDYPALKYWGKMDLKTYTVEIMYSIYDNDPEYFLMQAQLETPIETSNGLTADKIWYIGIIQNDEYYIWDCGYGLNPYEASGFGESVKYHAFGHYAVQTGENELTEVIYNEETGVWEQRVLTDAEKRIYGEYNDVSDCDLYYKE